MSLISKAFAPDGIFGRDSLKYSGPRSAISFPPFRPSLTAAGSFFFGKIQRVWL